MTLENTENSSMETKQSKEKTSIRKEYKGFINSVFGNQLKVWIPKLGKEYLMDGTKLFDEEGNSLSNAKPNDLVLKTIIISDDKAVLTDPSKIKFFENERNENGEER